MSINFKELTLPIKKNQGIIKKEFVEYFFNKENFDIIMASHNELNILGKFNLFNSINNNKSKSFEEKIILIINKILNININSTPINKILNSLINQLDEKYHTFEGFFGDFLEYDIGYSIDELEKLEEFDEEDFTELSIIDDKKENFIIEFEKKKEVDQFLIKYLLKNKDIIKKYFFNDLNNFKLILKYEEQNMYILPVNKNVLFPIFLKYSKEERKEEYYKHFKIFYEIFLKETIKEEEIFVQSEIKNIFKNDTKNFYDDNYYIKDNEVVDINQFFNDKLNINKIIEFFYNFNFFKNNSILIFIKYIFTKYLIKYKINNKSMLDNINIFKIDEDLFLWKIFSKCFIYNINPKECYENIVKDFTLIEIDKRKFKSKNFSGKYDFESISKYYEIHNNTFVEINGEYNLKNEIDIDELKKLLIFFIDYNEEQYVKKILNYLVDNDNNISDIYQKIKSNDHISIKKKSYDINELINKIKNKIKNKTELNKDEIYAVELLKKMNINLKLDLDYQNIFIEGNFEFDKLISLNDANYYLNKGDMNKQLSEVICQYSFNDNFVYLLTHLNKYYIYYKTERKREIKEIFS